MKTAIVVLVCICILLIIGLVNVPKKVSEVSYQSGRYQGRDETRGTVIKSLSDGEEYKAIIVLQDKDGYVHKIPDGFSVSVGETYAYKSEYKENESLQKKK